QPAIKEIFSFIRRSDMHKFTASTINIIARDLLFA
ncbi:MAG: hypothetical protein ACI8V5_003867, partial [Limisphaerales bacterium]